MIFFYYIRHYQAHLSAVYHVIWISRWKVISILLFIDFCK